MMVSPLSVHSLDLMIKIFLLVLEMQFTIKNTRWRKRAKHWTLPNSLSMDPYQSHSYLNIVCPTLCYTAACGFCHIYGRDIYLVCNSSIDWLIDTITIDYWLHWNATWNVTAKTLRLMNPLMSCTCYLWCFNFSFAVDFLPPSSSISPVVLSCLISFIYCN